MPAMTTCRERLRDIIEALPLAIDQVAQVNAECEIAPVEVFDSGTEFPNRVAIEASALCLDVGKLCIRHQSDFESIIRRAARDERRAGSRNDRGPQKTAAGNQTRFHGVIY